MARMKLWHWALPLAGILALALSLAVPDGVPLAVLQGLALGGAVFAAVHHAEVVAHKVGEPFGTLVLALAVTVIEVALILAVWTTGGPDKAGLARDTLYAAIMIVANGVVGLCLLTGGIRHHIQEFRLEGTGAALAVLTALSMLILVLPNTTSTTVGPMLSPAQLVFAGLMSLVLYAVFVFVQTVRHRDYFLPRDAVVATGAEQHAPPPGGRDTMLSLLLMIVSLAAVVGLAKALSPAVERAIAAAGAPEAVVGIVIALVVLAPESVAALRAAAANRLQVSLNLALGSALASIGLTIPVVAAVAVATGRPLMLGLPPKETVLLAVTLLVGILTLGTGRTTLLQGAVHLVIFAAFLFLSVVP
jgi:Ca2+:H+ antiporter